MIEINNISDIKSLQGRFISFDTETTGLNYVRDHIISIAGVEIINGKFTGRQFQGFLQPRVIIHSEATKVHKMNNCFYKKYYSDIYKSDYDIIKGFTEFVNDSVLIAYNANFDFHFLNKELKYWKLPAISREKFFCSMRLFKNIFGEFDSSFKKGITLSKCCEYLGVNSAFNDYHSALYDAFMCGRLTISLFDFIKKKEMKIKKIEKNQKNKKKSEIDMDLEIGARKENKEEDTYTQLTEESNNETTKDMSREVLNEYSEKITKFEYSSLLEDYLIFENLSSSKENMYLSQKRENNEKEYKEQSLLEEYNITDHDLKIIFNNC